MSELIKIAPTMSAEERYKMMLPDIILIMERKKPLLSETEADAVRTCPMSILFDYNYHIGLVMWIMMLWVRDWNAERLRVSFLITALLYETERSMRRADDEDLKDKDPFDLVRSILVKSNEAIKELYCYRDSIPLLEKELYGMPFFGAEMQKMISECYEEIEKTISYHNDIVQEICRIGKNENYFKAAAEHVEEYLLEKPYSDPVQAEAIAQNLIETAQSDAMRRR